MNTTVKTVVTQDEKGIWTDQNGNSWSNTNEEAAIIFSKEMINCYNCHDCAYCTNCKDCTNCNFCTDCIGIKYELCLHKNI